MKIEFNLDSIEEWIDNYDIYGNCTCTWADDDPDDCVCGLIAIEYRLRQDVNNTFAHPDDMFPRDALVEIQVVAGRLRPIFDTINRHKVFDCNCDNLRAKIKFANLAANVHSPFFDTDDEDSDDLSSDFLDR